MGAESRSAHLQTLGCARNSVDSEELAGRLEASGWSLVDDPEDAAVTLINTCGFVEAAKRESIDALLNASDIGHPVVAVGCLAERYGAELAAELSEASAVLSFDDYAAIGERLDDVVAGRTVTPHQPRDRRRLLPVTPVLRPPAAVSVGIPGHGGGPRAIRRRLEGGPVAPVKLASGCDRRCTFCAIPSFRGAFVSRPPEEILADVHWLAANGAREVILVSENTTSYGKDLGDLRLLETLLVDVAAVPGIVRVRLSYLQPAELRPSLIDAITATPGVAPYLDLSVQHASGSVLRRMRRYGDGARFLQLLDAVRAQDPRAGVRSNVIVGFPGETTRDFAELERFLGAAGFDSVGVFGYSDEDGTEAVTLDSKVRPATITRRVGRLASLVDELVAQRAADRIGDEVDVLVEAASDGIAEGRAAHQGPDDGTTTIAGTFAVGELVHARVLESDGVDLVAQPIAHPLAERAS
ncbi:MAG: ribosomal protein methylthiotransferase [Frankiales bacterium]|jgi:ribosomal protein S12 methylthiotransferase RimO|nr:ribosomal protein methylthiotransferase [Frankiales bacterium]